MMFGMFCDPVVPETVAHFKLLWSYNSWCLENFANYSLRTLQLWRCCNLLFSHLSHFLSISFHMGGNVLWCSCSSIVVDGRLCWVLGGKPWKLRCSLQYTFLNCGKRSTYVFWTFGSIKILNVHLFVLKHFFG